MVIKNTNALLMQSVVSELFKLLDNQQIPQAVLIELQAKLEQLAELIKTHEDSLKPEDNAMNLQAISQQLKSQWQDNASQNLILARRGLDWLNNHQQNITEIDFLNRMVNLGQLLSEGSQLKNSVCQSNYSPVEARKIRASLSSNPEFLKSIYNKSHAKHKINLDKLQQLNRAIVGSK